VASGTGKLASVGPPKSWPRQAFFSFLTVWLYIVIVLALTEGALRILGFEPRRAARLAPGTDSAMPDDELGWVSRPGTFQSREAGHVPMTFLDDHSRRSWKTLKKPGQRAEVLVVGCSFTEGYGVVDEDTFSYLLNARYPYLMFHNFGTGGYGTYQALIRVKRDLARPDASDVPLVIYGFIDLHMQRNVAVPNWVRSLAMRRNQYVVPPHVRMTADGLEYYGPSTIQFWPLESHSALITLLANAYLEARLRTHGPQLPATTALIEQMDQFVTGLQKRFLVVLLNHPPKGLVPFLDDHKIEHVDCENPAFDKGPSQFHLGGTGHPNAAQNALWAACIGDWIDHNLTTLATP
jgi:hypothetical protein